MNFYQVYQTYKKYKYSITKSESGFNMCINSKNKNKKMHYKFIKKINTCIES